MERTLYKIVGAIRTPLLIDNATKNRLFGHYARLLVNLDLSCNILKFWWNGKVMHFLWRLNTRGYQTFASIANVLDIM